MYNYYFEEMKLNLLISAFEHQYRVVISMNDSEVFAEGLRNVVLPLLGNDYALLRYLKKFRFEVELIFERDFLFKPLNYKYIEEFEKVMSDRLDKLIVFSFGKIESATLMFGENRNITVDKPQPIKRPSPQPRFDYLHTWCLNHLYTKQELELTERMSK